jgi:hypothetical protein
MSKQHSVSRAAAQADSLKLRTVSKPGMTQGSGVQQGVAPLDERRTSPQGTPSRPTAKGKR